MTEIDPKLWGSSVWDSLHWIIEGYPSRPSLSHKQKYKAYIENLGLVLPCPQCQTHFRSVLTEVPVDTALNSQVELREWGRVIHNKVNALAGKTQFGKHDFTRRFSRPALNAQPIRRRAIAQPVSLTASQNIARVRALKAQPVQQATVQRPSIHRRPQSRRQRGTSFAMNRVTERANAQQSRIQARLAKTQSRPQPRGCGCGGKRR